MKWTFKGIILETVNPDDLAAAIAAMVIKQLGPVIRQANAPEVTRCASRDQMAKILGWSLAKLDRRTAQGLPSIMDDGRRIYVVEDVLAYLRDATPEAEARARIRQADRIAAKAAKAAIKQKKP